MSSDSQPDRARPSQGMERGERVSVTDDDARDPTAAQATPEVPDDDDDADPVYDPAADLGDDDGDDDDGDDDDDDVPPPDFYAVLGVAPDATPDELRRAYHRLVKLWHPDRYTGAPDELRARAERRMRQLNEAYRALSDPQTRAAYDDPHAGYATPVGDVINVFGQRASAYSTSSEQEWDGHASANPNGAGQFFGALALVLALALVGGAVGGGGLGAAAGFLILLGVVAVALAVGFFVTRSPLARWANGVLEAEPRGQAQASQPEGKRGAAPPPTAAPSASGPAHDAAGEPQADDATTTFEALIDEALTGVPHRFDSYLRNVVVRAEDEPDAETLRRAGVPQGHTLLGLYQGVSLARRGAGEVGPEVITIYRGPITRYCGGDLERIRRQVRATVLHELAHHFGVEHEDMPEWVK